MSQKQTKYMIYQQDGLKDKQLVQKLVVNSAMKK